MRFFFKAVQNWNGIQAFCTSCFIHLTSVYDVQELRCSERETVDVCSQGTQDFTKRRKQKRTAVIKEGGLCKASWGNVEESVLIIS